MQYTQFGEYSFATRHFCELLQYLAKNPGAKDARLGGYSNDNFWKKQQEHAEGVLELLQRAETSSEDLGEAVNKHFQKEDFNSSMDSIIVPVKVYKNKVQIGI